MSFKEYDEAAILAESIFGMFGKRKPKPKPGTLQDKIDKIPHELQKIDRNDRKKLGPDDWKAASKMNRRLEDGNLYQALRYYNNLISSTGNQYPDSVINQRSQNEKMNEFWDLNYREMFLKMGNTPALAKMMLEKAFKEMNFPPVQPIKQPYEVVPDLPEAPEFRELVDYIKLLLSHEKNLSREEIKRRVKDRWPGLKKYKGFIDARIGKAFNNATKSMVKIYRPDKEDIAEPENRNILRFPSKNG